MNELEKLVPLLNGLSDQAFSAFVADAAVTRERKQRAAIKSMLEAVR